MLFLVNVFDILRGWTLFYIVYKTEYIGKTMHCDSLLSPPEILTNLMSINMKLLH